MNDITIILVGYLHRSVTHSALDQCTDGHDSLTQTRFPLVFPLRSALTSAGRRAPSSGRTGAVRRRWRCAAGRCRGLPADSAAEQLPARAWRGLQQRYGAAITSRRCRRRSSWSRRRASRWRRSRRSSFTVCCCLFILVRVFGVHRRWHGLYPELHTLTYTLIGGTHSYTRRHCCQRLQ